MRKQSPYPLPNLSNDQALVYFHDLNTFDWDYPYDSDNHYYVHMNQQLNWLIDRAKGYDNATKMLNDFLNWKFGPVKDETNRPDKPKQEDYF